MVPTPPGTGLRCGCPPACSESWAGASKKAKSSPGARGAGAAFHGGVAGATAPPHSGQMASSGAQRWPHSMHGQRSPAARPAGAVPAEAPEPAAPTDPAVGRGNRFCQHSAHQISPPSRAIHSSPLWRRRPQTPHVRPPAASAICCPQALQTADPAPLLREVEVARILMPNPRSKCKTACQLLGRIRNRPCPPSRSNTCSLSQAKAWGRARFLWRAPDSAAEAASRVRGPAEEVSGTRPPGGPSSRDGHGPGRGGPVSALGPSRHGESDSRVDRRQARLTVRKTGN